MRVVNGRLYHNFDVGAYTFVNNNGASVVDYLLTNECNCSCISDFSIHSLNEWSDHTPLSFSIRCKIGQKILVIMKVLTFSANKQHKYTHNGSKNQSFLYNTNGITHKSKHKLEQLRHCKPRDF